MTPILLLGDSLVADFDWQAKLPQYRVHNFGVPGAMTTDLLASLPVIREQVDYAEIIMVMIGTNDLLCGNHDLLHTLKKILIQLTQNYPSAETLVCSLFPMHLPHLPENTISSLNTHIEALTMRTGTCFLDVHSRLDSTAKEIFQDDGVHITPAAYEIWRRMLMEHIAFLLEND